MTGERCIHNYERATCAQCKKIDARRITLDNKDRHRGAADRSTVGPGGVVKCAACPARFTDREALQKHISAVLEIKVGRRGRDGRRRRA